jgi:hypothetical protein
MNSVSYILLIILIKSYQVKGWLLQVTTGHYLQHPDSESLFKELTAQFCQQHVEFSVGEYIMYSVHLEESNSLKDSIFCQPFRH